MQFHKAVKRIKLLDRTEEWKKNIEYFVDAEILKEIFKEYNDIEIDNLKDTKIDDLDINEDITKNFITINKKLSSGQNIILHLISKIVANIRFDSLILFDEPETHLHPNAISQLINTIYELVYKFQSYCIITTHSPLVIQEIFAKNVYVIEKHENILSIRKIGIETFGENLTILTEEVFGNKEIEKQYKKIIDKLVLLGKSYSEIISNLQLNELPISLNARLYIKSQIIK